MTEPRTIDRNLIADIEQFYYREARLLDDRKFQQWQGLLAEDIRYRVPCRHSPLLDPKKRDSEAFLNVEQELSQGLEAPYRDEDYLMLSIRVMRSFKQNSWSDNPLTRTRRFVSNVEVLPGPQMDTYKVYNNVMISYSRHQQDNHLFTVQRRDLLRKVEEDFRIAGREVIIDWNVVTGPSLGIFF